MTGQWTESEVFDRTLAAAAAACLVCCGVWWLVTLSPATALPGHQRDVAMQVVWLERAPRLVRQDDARSTAAPVSSAPRVAVTTPARARQRVPAGSDVERDDVPVTPAAGSGTRLDLTLPAVPLAFGAPTDRPVRRRDDIAPVIRIEVRDRSLGATLQGMTRGMICKELREAAAASLASHAQIEASMAQHGCRRFR